MRALYGLDKSIPAQFVIWLGHVLQRRFRHVDLAARERHRSGVRAAAGDAGTCVPRADHRLGVGGGMAIWPRAGGDARAEAGVDLFNGVALSIPDFLWGLIFILLFGVAMPIFDISGRVTPDARTAFRHAVLSHRKRRSAALRSDRRFARPYDHARHGARAAARRRDLANPQDLAEGGDASGLCLDRAHQRIFARLMCCCTRRCAMR